MGLEPFWNDARIEDLWIAIGLLAASGLLFWVASKRSNNVLRVLAVITLAVSLFIFLCVRCAP
jgi:hypothetical protein